MFINNADSFMSRSKVAIKHEDTSMFKITVLSKLQCSPNFVYCFLGFFLAKELVLDLKFKIGIFKL